MSRQELVSAFLEGRISRRGLIRRLVAGGVSTGAAISYAQLLRPAQADAQTTLVGDDHYPLVDLTIVDTSLANVVSNGRVRVSVTSTEEVSSIFLRVFLKASGGGVPIGQRFMTGFLSAAGRRTVSVPVATDKLAQRTQAVIYVQANANDAENYPALASARTTLS